MKILAINLTDEQRELFTEEFYSLWDSEIDAPHDTETPTPWGCPWMFGSVEELEGDTAEEMAGRFFRAVKQEIVNAIENETPPEAEVVKEFLALRKDDDIDTWQPMGVFGNDKYIAIFQKLEFGDYGEVTEEMGLKNVEIPRHQTKSGHAEIFSWDAQ